MDTQFYKTIAKSSAHIKSRTTILELVYHNRNLLDDLSTIAFDVLDKNHHKAIWIFEMLAEKNINIIVPNIDSI